MEIHSETMNRFCNQYKIIKHYIEDLPSQAIQTRFNPEKWSIHETVAYLNRYQYVFLERLNQIAAEVNPFFEVYRPENDAEFHFTSARTTGALMHDIYRIRQEIKRILDQLSTAECARVGTHAVLGRMNISQWLEYFLLHESNQFYKIFRQAARFWNNASLHQGNVIAMPLLGEGMKLEA